MRHRQAHRKLNRTPAHRKALRRNLAQSLFQHGAVRTTLAKAKDVRPFAERLITLARKSAAGSITARRQIHKLLSDRSFIPSDHQEAYDQMSDAKRHKAMRSRSGRRRRTGEPLGRLAFTAESVTHRLIHHIAPSFGDRPGGYTRIIRLAARRIGDGGRQALLQLVGQEESPGSITRPGKTARRRRADVRYATAIKAGKSGGTSSASTVADAPNAGKRDTESGAETESVGEESSSE